jgi:hypothetical protein
LPGEQHLVVVLDLGLRLVAVGRRARVSRACEVNCERLRGSRHTAAAVYWDMPPPLSRAVIAFMAMR